MTSRVVLDIEAGQAHAAELFADPRNNPRWMDDLKSIEPIRGTLGEPGSVYRMVPKRGRGFVATVMSRALPTELKLFLDGPRVSVAIKDTFVGVSEHRTKLISEEVFRFKGLVGRITGLMARKPIEKAHRRHMEAFKRFAESRAAS